MLEASRWMAFLDLGQKIAKSTPLMHHVLDPLGGRDMPIERKYGFAVFFAYDIPQTFYE
jgi:hypothetical protein